MKVLFTAAEVAPFIKTGGLADVAGSLPQFIKAEGVDIRVVLPYYGEIKKKYSEIIKYIGYIYVKLSWRKQYCGIYETELDGIKYYFLDNEYYFMRDGLYGHYDDAERFSFFSKAVLEIFSEIKFWPDIIHCNDWHTGLVPVFLDKFYKKQSQYSNIRTIYTIHNIQYQGVFGKDVFYGVFDMHDDAISVMEYNNSINIMKGAIEASNIVSTVSKTYAEEIKYEYYSYGLHHILREREYKLTGIVNGIDTDLYNPINDENLFTKYSIKTRQHKSLNKKGLQKQLGLIVENETPLIAMITRLSSQKGLSLVESVLDEIMQENVQLVILGTGDSHYEGLFRMCEFKYPHRFKAYIGFSSEMASKIYGGADMFLMPSQSEPCGLAQMIAMRYGTIPIVRETGGLKDTVLHYNHETKEGNGITFANYDSQDMLNAIKKTLSLYREKNDWRIIKQNAMQGDYSWKKSAKEYLELYLRVCE